MPKTSVSGFTRSEKFIMETLLELKAAKEDLENRMVRVETRLDMMGGAVPGATPTPASPVPAASADGWDGKTKFWVAIISAIGGTLAILVPVLVTQCGTSVPVKDVPAVETPAPVPVPGPSPFHGPPPEFEVEE